MDQQQREPERRRAAAPGVDARCLAGRLSDAVIRSLARTSLRLRAQTHQQAAGEEARGPAACASARPASGQASCRISVDVAHCRVHRHKKQGPCMQGPCRVRPDCRIHHRFRLRPAEARAAGSRHVLVAQVGRAGAVSGVVPPIAGSESACAVGGVRHCRTARRRRRSSLTNGWIARIEPWIFVVGIRPYDDR